MWWKTKISSAVDRILGKPGYLLLLLGYDGKTRLSTVD
jgi:hypothetical protein